MIEKDVIFSKFFILRVETAWPTWMALCRNVRMSVPTYPTALDDAQNKQKR